MLKIINCDKLPKSLKKFIKKNIVSKKLTDSLAGTISHLTILKSPLVSDKRLGQLIKDKFSIKCKNNLKTHELMRGIKL